MKKKREEGRKKKMKKGIITEKNREIYGKKGREEEEWESVREVNVGEEMGYGKEQKNGKKRRKRR